MMAKLTMTALTKERHPPPYEQYPLLQPDQDDPDKIEFETTG